MAVQGAAQTDRVHKLKVLVSAASMHGATGGIAQAIGEVLSERGFATTAIPPEEVNDVATAILPALQHLQTGQWVPMSPAATPTDRTAFKVHSFEVGEWLLWSKPDSTWAWRLTPAGSNGTRLVTRVHAVYDWQHPLTAVLGVLLMEFGDFAMLRRMLRGIKARAEALAQDASRPAASWMAA